MSPDLSETERKELVEDLAAELDTGRYGDRFVLSRRQLLSLAGGSAGVAGLIALGVDPATAQSAAGQVGTSSEPVDVFGFDVEAGNSFTDPAGVTHSGELADLSDTGTALAVEDDGATVLSDSTAINFGSELDASDDGDGTVTASVAPAVVSDGDGTERQLWVIANGAAGAGS